MNTLQERVEAHLGLIDALVIKEAIFLEAIALLRESLIEIKRLTEQKATTLGIPDSRCNYLMPSGFLCNKCGRMHDNGGWRGSKGDHLRAIGQPPQFMNDCSDESGFSSGFSFPTYRDKP